MKNTESNGVLISVRPRLANLCLPVRLALEAIGASHKRCLDACNAHLGNLKLATDKDGNEKPITATTGDMKLRVKKGLAKVSVKLGAISFEDTINDVSRFIAWHDAVNVAFEVANFETVSIPPTSLEWVKGFIPAPENKPAVNA